MESSLFKKESDDSGKPAHTSGIAGVIAGAFSGFSDIAENEKKKCLA